MLMKIEDSLYLIDIYHDLFTDRLYFVFEGVDYENREEMAKNLENKLKKHEIDLSQINVKESIIQRVNSGDFCIRLNFNMVYIHCADKEK